MLDHIRHTDQLPALVPVAPAAADTPTRRLTPADFRDLPYAPALLLPIQLDQAITSHKHYQESCKWGYEAYFEEMYELTEEEESIFVERIYSRSEVLEGVVQDMKNCPRWPTSLARRTGFIRGWLSALALTDLPAAQLGLHLLLHLSKLEQLATTSPIEARQQIDAILRLISERGER